MAHCSTSDRLQLPVGSSSARGTLLDGVAQLLAANWGDVQGQADPLAHAITSGQRIAIQFEESGKSTGAAGGFWIVPIVIPSVNFIDRRTANPDHLNPGDMALKRDCHF